VESAKYVGVSVSPLLPPIHDAQERTASPIGSVEMDENDALQGLKQVSLAES